MSVYECVFMCVRVYRTLAKRNENYLLRKYGSPCSVLGGKYSNEKKGTFSFTRSL